MFEDIRSALEGLEQSIKTVEKKEQDYQKILHQGVSSDTEAQKYAEILLPLYLTEHAKMQALNSFALLHRNLELSVVHAIARQYTALKDFRLSSFYLGYAYQIIHKLNLSPEELTNERNKIDSELQLQQVLYVYHTFFSPNEPFANRQLNAWFSFGQETDSYFLAPYQLLQSSFSQLSLSNTKTLEEFIQKASHPSYAAKGKDDVAALQASRLQEHRSKLEKARHAAIISLEHLPVETVQAIWSTAIKECINTLCEEVKQELGEPYGYRFCLLSLGSLSRDEACLRSDIEFALLCEEIEGHAVDTQVRDNIQKYFQAFVGLLELKVIALGETNELFFPFGNSAIKNLDSLGRIKQRAARGLQFDEAGNYALSQEKNLFGFLSSLLLSTAVSSKFQIRQENEVMTDNHLYLYLEEPTDEDKRKIRLKYAIKKPNGIIINNKELTKKNISQPVWTRIITAIQTNQLESLSEVDKNKVLIETRKRGHTPHRDDLLRLIEVPEEITQSVKHILSGDKSELFTRLRLHESHSYLLSDAAELSGDKVLAKNFFKQRNIALQKSHIKNHWSYRRFLGYALGLPGSIEFPKMNPGKPIAIKHHLQFMQWTIKSLVLYYDIEEQNTIKRIQGLVGKNILPSYLGGLFIHVIRFLFEARLTAHAHYSSEDDQLYLSQRDDDLFSLKQFPAGICFVNELPIIYEYFNRLLDDWQRFVKEHAVISTDKHVSDDITNEFNFIIAKHKPSLLELLDKLLRNLTVSPSVSTKVLPLPRIGLYFIRNVLEHFQQRKTELSESLFEKGLSLTDQVIRTEAISKIDVLLQFKQVVVMPLLDLTATETLEQRFIKILQINPPEAERMIADWVNCFSMLKLEDKDFMAWYVFLFHQDDEQRIVWSELFYRTCLRVPQLEDVSLDILELADSNGFRLLEYINQQDLNSAILNLVSDDKLKTMTRKVTLYRTNQSPLQLHSDVVKKLLDDEGHIIHNAGDRAKEAYSYRRVHRLQYRGTDIFFKEHPDFPIMAYGSYLLNMRLTGHGAVLTELAILEVEQLTLLKPLRYPILISLTVPGKTLADVLKANDYPHHPLSTKYLSDCFLTEQIKHHGDALPQNFVIPKLKNRGHQLVCVDLEQMFVDSATKEGWLFKTTKIQEVNILTCLPELQPRGLLFEQGLHPEVVERFANLDINKILNNWLDTLERREQDYLKLVDDIVVQELNQRRGDKHPYLHRMVFPRGVLRKLAYDLWVIKLLAQEALAKYKPLFPQTIVEHVSGKKVAAKYFAPSLATLSPHKRLTQVCDRTVSQSNSEYLKFYMAGRKNLQELTGSDYSIQQARHELKGFYLDERSERAGAAGALSTLQHFHITVINLTGLTAEEQKNILQRYYQAERKMQKFYHLHLESVVEFNDEKLQLLLSGSMKSLQSLTLKIVQGLSDKTIVNLTKDFSLLTELVLHSVNFSSFINETSAITFNTLRALYISYCEHLISIALRAPKLEHVEIKSNTNLETVDITAPKLDFIAIEENQLIKYLSIKPKLPEMLSLIGISKKCRFIPEKELFSKAALAYAESCEARQEHDFAKKIKATLMILDKIEYFIFSFVLHGADTATGSTSLTRRFMYDTFNPYQRPTSRADFIQKIITVDNKMIKLMIWDLQAQERNDMTASFSYRDCKGGMIIFDLSDKLSFKQVSKRYTYVDDVKDDENFIVIIVGNKNDLTDKREVSYEEGLALATQLSCHYIETSAKTGENVNEAFQFLAECIYQKFVMLNDEPLPLPNYIERPANYAKLIMQFSSVVTAPKVLNPSAEEKIPENLSDTDSDFEPTTMRKIK